MNEIWIALIGIGGSAGIWQFLQYRHKAKIDQERYKKETSTDTLYRDDLKNRVCKLEDLLAESSKEKDEMRSRIEQLIAEVNSLRVEVEYLKRENDRLKDRR